MRKRKSPAQIIREHYQRVSSAGGKARAAALSARRRKEISALGVEAARRYWDEVRKVLKSDAKE